MHSSKPIFASRTIIASVIALIAMALSASGVSQDFLLPAVQAQVVDTVLIIIQSVSTLAAIYFRITASMRLQ